MNDFRLKVRWKTLLRPLTPNGGRKDRSTVVLGHLALGVALISLLAACRGRPRSEQGEGPQLSGDGHIAILDLRSPISESTVTDSLFPLPASRTYAGLVRTLERLEDDRRLSGVFVKVGPEVGFHRAAEIGEALHRLSENKLPVFCHAHRLKNSSVWLTLRGCDRTWVSAAGDVATVGIAAELAYVKGAFEKLGVEADMLSMGKYKSGGEALTRKSPSPESKRNLQETLAHLRRVWLQGISKGQENAEILRVLVEEGPWTPERARDRGLVSDVGFEDQALDAIKKEARTTRLKDVYGPSARDKSDSGLAEMVRVLVGASERTGGRKRIAVVPAVGAITMEAGGALARGSGITAAAMTRTIRRLRKDGAVRAVVLRIDSPGGSPLASDLIWRELMLTREKKPVIISIGSMAASGGYYIASAGTKIVSSKTAIVGSIGVFGGKIVLGEALEKIGINHYAVPASEQPGAAARALHESPMQPWDEATRKRVRASMRRIYDLFVARVAQGREIDKEKVYDSAEGRIFLAGSGKKRGLLDELGGLGRALEVARQEADLPADAPVVVEGAAESIFEALVLGPEPDAGEVQAALWAYQRRRAEAESQFQNLRIVQALQPFAALVQPLIDGETVVAALPLTMTVH